MMTYKLGSLGEAFAVQSLTILLVAQSRTSVSSVGHYLTQTAL